ncbi:hypothetical protein FKW77_004493 [Venturia effusa]|uniref:Protoporphyrinogen oxidase n=1 Tax=Venturia effusa TaxID=50376 RepID=A0A517LR58_9PEZI|nr:hypothetical protein FKW77_004493 [Venturia effusa]
MRLLKPPILTLQASPKQLRLKQILPSLSTSIASSSASLYISRRNYASNPAPRQNIAIIGSGITGLTTAYYLSKIPEPPNVTIFEASPRIEDIGLADEIIFVPKDSPAARDRWLYYPDHLVHVPHPSQGILKVIRTLFTEKAFEGVAWAGLTEFFKNNRPDDLEDESVGDFISRRMSKKMVDRILSGVLHGIYAGDAYQLSAKSLFPAIWYGEKAYTSVFASIMVAREQQLVRQEDFDMTMHLAKRAAKTNPTQSSELDRKLHDSSVFTLKRGLMSMTERMESLLNMAENVTFRTNTPITSAASSGPTQPETYDQVISTIFSGKVPYLAPSEAQDKSLLPSLLDSSAVTVSVVNLYYPDARLLPIRGFGYLIPQATPLSQNPELALGVVFDSEITREQDTAPGTKLTVMIGGHWWDGWETLPTDAELIEKAKSVLRRHLGITQEPEAFHVSTQKDCIPQYKVGHTQRMKEAHHALLRHFGGRLKVAGNSYTGVGVNDCLMAAREIALATQAGNWSSRTGLESFETDVKFCVDSTYAALDRAKNIQVAILNLGMIRFKVQLEVSVANVL